MRQALSLKKADNAVFTTELKFTGKTKDAVKALDSLKLADKAVLLVVADKTPEILRSTNNLEQVKTVRNTYLNVFDIMNADAVVFETSALKGLETWLIGEEK